MSAKQRVGLMKPLEAASVAAMGGMNKKNLSAKNFLVAPPTLDWWRIKFQACL